MTNTQVIFFGIISIVTLEIIALSKGIDGYCLAIAIGAIASLVGYLFGKKKRGIK